MAHAYLFAGPRGTGKTSMAKILAKSLNCEKGPTTTPCLVCESCRTIHDATAIDVIEMDAASHRGIDDIREIRDKVVLRPVLGRYKIYIVDEAHMLTKEASNAVLKTLEEPPDHAIFVLCTTEMQAMLPTIRSRCQRFAFHRPTHAETSELLEPDRGGRGDRDRRRRDHDGRARRRRQLPRRRLAARPAADRVLAADHRRRRPGAAGDGRRGDAVPRTRPGGRRRRGRVAAAGGRARRVGRRPRLGDDRPAGPPARAVPDAAAGRAAGRPRR